MMIFWGESKRHHCLNLWFKAPDHEVFCKPCTCQTTMAHFRHLIEMLLGLSSLLLSWSQFPSCSVRYLYADVSFIHNLRRYLLFWLKASKQRRQHPPVWNTTWHCNLYPHSFRPYQKTHTAFLSITSTGNKPTVCRDIR